MRDAEEITKGPGGWLAGAMQVEVRVDLPGTTSPVDVVSRLRRVTTDILGDIHVPEPAQDALPPLLIPTLANSQQLLFVPITLASQDPAVMKRAVGRLNNDDGRKRFADAGLAPVGATPNWFGAAQDCQG